MASTDDSDRSLLARLRQWRNAAAVAEVVRRYGGLVYGLCRRRVGDGRAGEVCVAVFRRLIDRPQDVSGPLPVWLHATTLLTAGAPSGAVPADYETDWAVLAPHLDQAIADLSPLDRWHLLVGFCSLPPRGHAPAHHQEFDEALASTMDSAFAELSRRLAQVGGTVTAAKLQELIDRNAIELPPPPLAAELGRLALDSISHAEPAIVPGAKRAKLIWIISIAGLAYVIITGVVVYWLSGDAAERRRQRELQSAPKPAPAAPPATPIYDPAPESPTP